MKADDRFGKKFFLLSLLLTGILASPGILNGQIAELEKLEGISVKSTDAVKQNQSKNNPDSQNLISPEEIVQRIDTDAKKTKTWFSRERDNIFHFLIGSALSIFAGAVLAWGLHRIATGYIRKKDRQECMPLPWEILEVISSPLILLGVVLCSFLFFIPLLKSLPKNLHEIDMRCFYATFTLIIAWSIFRIVSVMDKKIRKIADAGNNTIDHLTMSMIGNTMKIAIAVTAILFIGQNIFHLDITALLAGAGVIGLAVALAAKDTVSNFFGTIVIIADAPFRLGDRIRVGEINGIVTHVGMRSSKIMTENESLYTIPNSLLTNASVCNVNQKGRIKHVTDIGLTYATTPEQMEQAMKILHEITDNFHGPDAAGFCPHIYFSEFADSSMNIHLIMWFKTNSFKEEELLRNELNMTILRRLNEAGLEMAYPTQTIYLENQTK